MAFTIPVGSAGIIIPHQEMSVDVLTDNYRPHWSRDQSAVNVETCMEQDWPDQSLRIHQDRVVPVIALNRWPTESVHPSQAVVSRQNTDTDDWAMC